MLRWQVVEDASVDFDEIWYDMLFLIMTRTLKHLRHSIRLLPANCLDLNIPNEYSDQLGNMKPDQCSKKPLNNEIRHGGVFSPLYQDLV